MNRCTIPKRNVDATESDPSGRRKRVLQIGPAPGTSGGIAAVIEETLAFESVYYDQLSCPSWVPDGGLAAVSTPASAALHMCRKVRTWDIAHVHLSEYGSFVREGALLALAKLLRKRAVVTLHGAELAEHAAKYRLLTRYVLGSADLVLCLGPNHAEIVERAAKVDTRIVTNPLGAEAFSLQVEQAKRSESARFLFAGEVGTRKGHDRLIGAWAKVRSRVPEAELRVAGPIADGYSVKSGTGISYLGNLSRTQLRDEIAAATATVLPSRAEVLPMTIIESHAQGTPTIYTKVGEWQVFRDAPGIRLIDVDGRKEGEIVASLADALTEQASDTRDYGPDLTDWTRKLFSSEVVSAQLDDAYDWVLGGPPGTARAARYGNAKAENSSAASASRIEVTERQ